MVKANDMSPGEKAEVLPYRVMLVDDSAVIRGLEARVLETDPLIKVVSSVASGKAALRALDELPVDVVVLDIEMPEMDGLTALPLLLAKQPHIKIIMSSALSQSNADLSIRALMLGAADYIPKPSSAEAVTGEGDYRHSLTSKVKALGLASRRVSATNDDASVAVPVPSKERRFQAEGKQASDSRHRKAFAAPRPPSPPGYAPPPPAWQFPLASDQAGRSGPPSLGSSSLGPPVPSVAAFNDSVVLAPVSTVAAPRLVSASNPVFSGSMAAMPSANPAPNPPPSANQRPASLGNNALPLAQVSVGATSRAIQTAGGMALRSSGPDRPDIIAIGSSTGGPQALFAVLQGLQKLSGVPQPIVITQHMPVTFTTILAEHITRQSGMSAREGIDGEMVLGGRVYVAPGDFHMTIESKGNEKVIRLNKSEPENFCRPAVDPLFRSVSKAYGKKVLACILTGMGSDGSRAAKSLVEAGGTLIAQDEATSVVWGMPGAAAATGMCSAILPLGDIAAWIYKFATKRAG